MYRPLSKTIAATCRKKSTATIRFSITAVAAGRGSRLTTQKRAPPKPQSSSAHAPSPPDSPTLLGTFDDALLAARRAGVSATSYSVPLPKAAAALPARAAPTKPDVAAGPSRLGQRRRQGECAPSLPAPAPTSSVAEKEVATAFARSIARINDEPAARRLAGYAKSLSARTRASREKGESKMSNQISVPQ